MTRAAILLVGELRTWKYASKYILKNLNVAAEKIDWYLVTWDINFKSGDNETKVTDDDVLLSFIENNVKPHKYKIIPTLETQKTTFYNQAWLSKVANILKRETEQEENFVYDIVIETRPDIYVRCHENNKKEVVNTEFEILTISGQHHEVGVLIASDLYFNSKSYTNDILDNRYNFKKTRKDYTQLSMITWIFNNHHWVLSQYLSQKNITISKIKFGTYSFYFPLRLNFPLDQDLDRISLSLLGELSKSYKKPNT